MSLQIDFPPDVGARLIEEASRRGYETAEYVRRVVEWELVRGDVRDDEEIGVTVTVRKTTPDASGPWLPEIELGVPGRETELVLSLDEAEELQEELAHWIGYTRKFQQEQEQAGPTD